MKKFILIPSILFVLASCEPKVISSVNIEAKNEKLDSLKDVVSALNAQIAALDAELKVLNKTDDDTPNVIAVSVDTIKANVFKNFINIQGKVDAEENIALSSQLPGVISQIYVKPGHNVKIGQVLAKTDDRAIQQQILDLKSNLDLSQQVYVKQKSLWGLGIGTEMQLLQAEANFKSLESKMATLNEQLRMTKIVSPINGTVDAVNIKLGQAVSPGMPSIRVINFTKLKVVAEVAESYASKIKRGSEVVITFPDMDDTVIGKVNFMSRSIKAETRTFTVEVILNSSKEFYPNMIANLSINDYKSSKPVLTLPVKLIQKDENDEMFVYTVKGDVVIKKIVKEGIQYNGQVEVLDGLVDGDLIIDEGYNVVIDGDFVEIAKDETI